MVKKVGEEKERGRGAFSNDTDRTKCAIFVLRSLYRAKANSALPWHCILVSTIFVNVQ